MKISIGIQINGHELHSDNETFNRLQQLFRRSRLWPDLIYTVIEPEVNTSEPDFERLSSDNINHLDGEISSDYSNEGPDIHANKLHVRLRCKVFDHIFPDTGLELTVGFVRNVFITFKMTSPKLALHFQRLVDNLQYCLSSLFLNLEFKYPFVFSYYGRRLIQLNYKTLTHTMAMLHTPLGITETPETHSVVAIALGKLQNAISTEFNNLNIMKECDFNHHRSRLCRKFDSLAVVDDSRWSIKSKAFKLLVFEAVDNN